jgi:hypothetical protein
MASSQPGHGEHDAVGGGERGLFPEREPVRVATETAVAGDSGVHNRHAGQELSSRGVEVVVVLVVGQQHRIDSSELVRAKR